MISKTTGVWNLYW